ncbi:MAG: 30S ribosome-binding factor RbfA [Gammaproteobacteria bacterium]
MAREYGRKDRVASQIQKELAVIVQREFGARLGFVTINEVVVSKDLAVAKIYFTVMNRDEAGKNDSAKLLNEHAGHIRHDLAKCMRLRSVPELRFYYDDSFDTGMRVAQLLSDLPIDPDQEHD